MAISHKITQSWIYSNYPTTDVTFKKECNFFLLVACNEMIVIFAAELERDHYMSVVCFKYNRNNRETNILLYLLFVHDKCFIE